MKKATLIITAVLACAILCYAAYVWTLVDNYPYKIWLHRCNSIEKLPEKEHRSANIEGARRLLHLVLCDCAAPVEPLSRATRQCCFAIGHSGQERLRACPLVPSLLV